MTISQKLIDVNTAKQNIKTSIEAKGVDTTGVAFTDYHTKIDEIVTGGGGGTEIVFDTWNRASDWLTVPTITETSEEVYVLYGVNNAPANKILFVNDTSAITVDWGDGTIENYPSGSYCEHNYDFNNPALDGTLTSRGFKQALIHITPQTTFASGILLNFQQQPTGYRPDQNISVLEVHFAIANGNVYFPTVANIAGSTSCRFFDCEYVNIKNWNATSLTSKFRSMVGLAKVDLPMTPSVGAYNAMVYAFDECYSLLEPPIIDTSSVTNFQNAFSNSGVQTIPAYDYSSATTIPSMFFNALKLVMVPDMNCPNLTSITSLFYQCESLIQAPIVTHTNPIANYSSVFGYCQSLSHIPPEWNPPGITSMNGTFTQCRSLTHLPDWDYSNVYAHCTMYGCQSLTTIPESFYQNNATVTGANLFRDCYSLVSLPQSLTNLTITSSMTSMFYNAYALQNIPAFQVGAGQISGTFEYRDVFRECRSLIDIGPIDMTQNQGITGTSNAYYRVKSLQRLQIIGLAETFSINDANLDTDALNELFTNLATVSAETLTITGNAGAATCDRTIATAKGWTVVG